MERETAIGFDDSITHASITTFNRAIMRKIDGYCEEFPEIYKVEQEYIFDGVLEGKEYSCPKEYVTFRKPRKMTEKQKEAASKRMKKYHKEKKKSETGMKGSKKKGK